MSRKTRSLSEPDRRAVDLVLDPGHSVVTGVSPPRVAAVSRLLSMLDRLPAADPPVDLSARTMVRIAVADAVAAQPGETTGIDLQY